MTRIELIGADLFGFVRDDPRPSAFYWPLPYRKNQLQHA
jgi:hypothetical protein